MKKIIAIIPARAGSKGIPGKNTKLLAGKPMIAYIIAAAKAVRGLERVIVSTEDANIAAIAKTHGAEVPFLRPSELAQDATTTLPVLQHAVATLATQENYHPDYVICLYPTSPLLKSARIQEVVDLCNTHAPDSVVSGTWDKGHFWCEVEGGLERLYPRKLENRQFAKPLFKENGAIYCTSTRVLTRQLVADKMLPIIMDADENVDVDHPEDFARVEALLMKGPS